MADRVFFPNVQAVVGLSASAEYEAERRRNPDLHGDHCVPVDSDLHGSSTDEANIRNDLPLYVGLGVAGRDVVPRSFFCQL